MYLNTIKWSHSAINKLTMLHTVMLYIVVYSIMSHTDRGGVSVALETFADGTAYSRLWMTCCLPGKPLSIPQFVTVDVTEMTVKF